MKRYMQKFIFIIFLVSIVFNVSSCSMAKNTTIDMTGRNGMWRASLNMNIGYNNELVVTLATEEFEPPSEVTVDVFAKGESVYSNKLKIKKDDFLHSGIYKSNFDSVNYLEKNYKDVSIVVSFNDESITIPLNSIDIIK